MKRCEFRSNGNREQCAEIKKNLGEKTIESCENLSFRVSDLLSNKVFLQHRKSLSKGKSGRPKFSCVLHPLNKENVEGRCRRKSI